MKIEIQITNQESAFGGSGGTTAYDGKGNPIITCEPTRKIKKTISAYDHNGNRIIYRSHTQVFIGAGARSILKWDAVIDSFTNGLNQYLKEQTQAK